MELNCLGPRVGWSRPGLWSVLNQALFTKWPAHVHHLSSTRVIGQQGKRCAAGWVNLKDPIKLTHLNMETC